MRNGRNYLPLVDAGLDLFGLDVSPEATPPTGPATTDATAQRLLCDDFRKFQSPLPRFDYLIAIQVFQHGADADVATYFEEGRRIASAGRAVLSARELRAHQIYHAHSVVAATPGRFHDSLRRRTEVGLARPLLSDVELRERLTPRSSR